MSNSAVALRSTALLRSDLMECEGDVDKVLSSACSVGLEDVQQEPLLNEDTLQQINRFGILVIRLSMLSL